MKTQIKQILNKLFAVVAVATVLTVTAFAQVPDRSENRPEQLNQMLRQEAQTKTLSTNQKFAANKSGTATLTNSANFQIGKDFIIAMFDADGIEDYEEAVDYAILDLVYLIDSLEGQPEAISLQKTLKSVVRGTSTAIQVRNEIEAASRAYLARQKTDQKWYFNAGQTTMNLMISTYMGDDAEIKKGLAALQTLIKITPKGTPKEIVDPMNGLAKYAAQKTYTEEDYAAIYDAIGSVMDAVSA